MKGFKDSTKMATGHRFSAAGHVRGYAMGGPVISNDRITGANETPQVDMRGPPRPDGSALVHREVPSTEQEVEGGGKTPLNPGYAKGGQAQKHFHVHNHYYTGGKVIKSGGKSPIKSSASTRKFEKHAEKYAEGGKTKGLATKPPSGPTGYRAGGAVYGTGGTINKMAVGGVAPPMRMQGGSLGQLAARARAPAARIAPPARAMPVGPRGALTQARGGSTKAGRGKMC